MLFWELKVLWCTWTLSFIFVTYDVHRLHLGSLHLW
jgi:hypothetical protein